MVAYTSTEVQAHWLECKNPAMCNLHYRTRDGVRRHRVFAHTLLTPIKQSERVSKRLPAFNSNLEAGSPAPKSPQEVPWNIGKAEEHPRLLSCPNIYFLIALGNTQNINQYVPIRNGHSARSNPLNIASPVISNLEFIKSNTCSITLPPHIHHIHRDYDFHNLLHQHHKQFLLVSLQQLPLLWGYPKLSR